jgi:hypothetical protein
MDVEFDVRVSSSVTKVIDETQFVAIFGGIAQELAMIAEVSKVIRGIVLIFPQLDVADII